MVLVIKKILVIFSLISATILAFGCSLFCESIQLNHIATSSQLDVDHCHDSNADDTEKPTGCEWDSGALDLPPKDKFANLTIFFSLLHYHISFFDLKVDSSIDLSYLAYFEVFFHIPAGTIPNINSVRIII